MKLLIMPSRSLLLRIVPVALCSIVALSACQKSQDEATTQADTTVIDSSATENTAQTTQPEPNATVVTDESATTPVQSQPADSQVMSSDNVDAASTGTEIKDFAKEAQITDVDYTNAAGESLKVTFQTSAIDELEANVMLPSGKRVLLTAPENQGNNPTYRSADGSIELVSHNGGGSVDLLQNGKLTSYDAASVDAEVVTSK